MKKNIFLTFLVCLFAVSGTQANVYSIPDADCAAERRSKSESEKPTNKSDSDADQQSGRKRVPITSGSNVMVQYAFPPDLKRHRGVRCSFISEAMLKQAGHLIKIQNVSWSIDGVINRLTAIQAMSTTTKNCTLKFKYILQDIQKKNLYSSLIEYNLDEGSFIVLYHPTTKDRLDEILLFHFGKNDETSVLQLTGDLRLSDMNRILRFSEKKK